MESETKNIIPMLSSSPPPMDGPTFDDDDDDGFGNFTTAGFADVESPLSDTHYAPTENDGCDFFQTAPPGVDHGTSHNDFADFQTSSDFADFANANTKSSTDFLPDFNSKPSNLQNRKSSSIDSNESAEKDKSTDGSRSASQMSTDPDFSSDRKTFNSDSNSFSSPDTLSLQSPSESVPAVGVKRQDEGPVSPDDNLSIDQDDDFGDFRTNENTPQEEEEDQQAARDVAEDETNAGELLEKSNRNNESKSVDRDGLNDSPSDIVGDYTSSGMTSHQDSSKCGSFQSLSSDTQDRNDSDREPEIEISTGDRGSASPGLEADLQESGFSDNQSANNENLDDDDDLNFGKFQEQPPVDDTGAVSDAGDAPDLVFRDPVPNDYGFSAFSEPYDFPDTASRDSDSDKYKESAETSDAKSDSQDEDQFGAIIGTGTMDGKGSEGVKELPGQDDLSGDAAKVENDGNDDEFGDFGAFEKPPSNNDNDDDFGDFGTFEKTPNNASDDFGAFQDTPNQDGDFGKFSDSAKAGGFADFQQSQDAQSTSDDFGAFSDSKTGGRDDTFSSFQETAPVESDKFGDFSGKDSGFGQFPTPSPSASTTKTHQPFAANKIQRVFAMCFPEVNNSAIAPDLVIELLIDCVGKVKEKKNEAGVSSKSNRHKSVKKEEQDLNVWNNLKDVDTTNALTYQWGGSSNDKTMLKSLGIDTRNILMAKKPSSSVPIFAANLTMLQPSKVGEKVERPEKDEAREEGGKDLTSQEALPQVEFDWSSSGLINPLDANSLNLDFFVTETSSTKKTNTKSKSVYDDELLGLEIEPMPMPARKPTSKPFADLLAKMNTATSMVKKRGQRDASLTDEAGKILDSLPNLDFMHAKVLMFPMKSSSSSGSLSST